jgi:hypothetical protein
MCWGTSLLQKRFPSVPAKPAVSAEKRENPATASRNAPRQYRAGPPSVTERLWRIPADASIQNARQRKGPSVHFTAFDARRIFRPVLPSCRAEPIPTALHVPGQPNPTRNASRQCRVVLPSGGNGTEPTLLFQAKCGRAAYVQRAGLLKLAAKGV